VLHVNVAGGLTGRPGRGHWRTERGLLEPMPTNPFPTLRLLSLASLAWLGATLVACAPERGAAAPNDPGPTDPTVEYVARQQILTELPMRVRLPARYGAERVFAFIHLWGTAGWSTVELRRDGQAWEGALSCRAVSTVTGDTRYFFLAVDGQGESVVSSGSPEWPHIATIVRSLPEGPQSLPDRPPPATCHDPADCPPDFAGCPAYTAVRPVCRTDDDCEASDGERSHAGRCAWDGYCERGSEPAGGSSDDLLAAAVRKVVRHPQTAKASTPALR